MDRHLFSHPFFHKYTFENIPLDEDVFLMDEKWMAEYEAAMVGMFIGGVYPVVGYISYAAVRNIGSSSLELSWYPNIYDRFHEVRVSLPRSAFIKCVGCYEYDEKPHIFVRSSWLTNLYLRAYSVFALVDAIGVKVALANGLLTRDKFVTLRDRIDDLAEVYPGISFISFADSLLIKSNWFVGSYDSTIKYTYQPELFIRLLPQIRSAYREVLGLEVYAILTQGSNEYYDDALLHISPTKNHISLNSLGLPFAQLMSIDNAVRSAIKGGRHDPTELYIDESFYHSLSFKYDFDKSGQPKHAYQAPLVNGDSHYFCDSYETILANLQS